MSKSNVFENLTIATQFIFNGLQVYERFFSKSCNNGLMQATLGLTENLPELFESASICFEKKNNTIFGVVPTTMCTDIFVEVKNWTVFVVLIIVVIMVIDFKKSLSQTNVKLVETTTKLSEV